MCIDNGGDRAPVNTGPLLASVSLTMVLENIGGNDVTVSPTAKV